MIKAWRKWNSLSNRTQPVTGTSDLFISRRIRFSPVRHYTTVRDKQGRRVIAAQTQYEYYKSKIMNHYRAWKRRRA